MMTILLFAGIILLVVVLLAIWLISTYNSFIKLRNKTEEAYSAMDVSLKKRYDLIPNYVEAVKGYASYENQTLREVINARNQAMAAAEPVKRMEEERQLSRSLKGLFALAEAYPELRANAGFVELQEQLRRIEEEIAGSRRYYNGVVNKYNTKTEMFPGNMLAGMFGFHRKPLYEVAEEDERENVRVSL